MAEEQDELFPELSGSAEHKKILKTARELIKIRTARKEALDESKAKEDEIQATLVEQLHNAGITKFQHDGIKCEIVARSEKVKAKAVVDEDEEE